jgi:hypothetical protein
MTKRDKSREARKDQMANMAPFTKVLGTGCSALRTISLARSN